MEDTNVERGSAAGRFTWVWAILAVASIGGFLFWLGATSEPTQVSVVEEAPEEDTTVMTVPVSTFAMETDSFMDEDIRLREMPVSSLLGERLFWTEVPSQQGMMTPYLLALDDALLADSVAVQTGETVTVVGRVHPVSDSVVSAWVESGTITEDQRIEAEFATSYMQVRDLRHVQDQGSGGGTGSGGGASDGGSE